MIYEQQGKLEETVQAFDNYQADQPQRKTERKILEVKFKILIKYRKSSQYVQGINDAENEILNSQLAYFPNIVSQCRIELGLIYDKQGKIVNHISTDNES